MTDRSHAALRKAAAAKSPAGASPATLALRRELADGTARKLATLALDALEIEICAGHDALWTIVRRERLGGLAIRVAHAPGGVMGTRIVARDEGGVNIALDTVLGKQLVELTLSEIGLPMLGITTTLTPAVPIVLPFLSRDLYPLGADDDPLGSTGRVEAAQRGLNSGLVYFHLDDPGFGTVLYLQNLTALNDYFVATKTKPDAAVGGEWPELGYLPPTPPQSGTPPVDPLPAGKPVVMSDARLVFHDGAACDEQDMGLRFVRMLGAAYRHIDRPETDHRDWVGRADRTIHDLVTAPDATIRHYGNRYAHPYVASEYPDVMVQMTLIAALRDYADWSGETTALEREFARGLVKFRDRKLGTMRRYLPNVGKDKDKNAVDSWYLYHPLLNLGRLALQGDVRARRLFTGSLDYAIKAARHFRYAWPIQFKVDDFSIITAARNDDGLGQTDVGGLYAYVMLQAYELTGTPRFLNEARAAIDAAKDMRFELNYQANLTAWGAAACMRLWRVTNERYYLLQSYVYLASFLHNCEIWESRIDRACHYRNFLGATCLHDAPYMAIFECFDSFAAFEHFLRDGGPDLDPAARMLISEYCKYALDRAWFYYPDALPADILAEPDKVRNGHIDRALSFPLEDLYADGQPAGQVGQEIYGAGAAMVFASRSFHRVEGAPFLLFCDHFLMASERTSATSLRLQLNGGEGCRARLSIIPLGRAKLPGVTLVAGGDDIAPQRQEGRIDFHVPATGQIFLQWRD